MGRRARGTAVNTAEDETAYAAGRPAMAIECCQRCFRKLIDEAGDGYEHTIALR